MSKGTKLSRIVSIVMSVVLAVGLVPLPAYGEDNGGGSSLTTGIMSEKLESIESLNSAAVDTQSEESSSDVISISAGTTMSAAVRRDGTVWTWGCGNMTGGGASHWDESPWDRRKESLGLAGGSFIEATPIMVFSGGGKSICCSMYKPGFVGTYNNNSGPVTAVLKDDGSLWMWSGATGNIDGVLGNGSANASAIPTKVLENVVSYDTSGYTSAAVTSDGSLYMWGRNNDGQLGTGAYDNEYSPVKVQGIEEVTQVSLGEHHCAALKKDGTLWTWGSNLYGQLGNGTYDSALHPIKVFENVKFISMGATHSSAITKDGKLYMWGDNHYGGLGNGGSTTSKSPINIPFESPVRAVELGENYSSAITEDDSLWMWGINSSGQLGNGSTTINYEPERVLRDVHEVALSTDHVIAMKTDNSIWTWGSNVGGQLGNHSTQSSSKPVRVKLGNVTATFDSDGAGAKAFDLEWDDSDMFKSPAEFNDASIKGYNEDMATMGVFMSEAAYHDNGSSVLSEFGYEYADASWDNTVDHPNYVIGYKALYNFGNPALEMVMAIRGSATGVDWVTNAKSVTDGYAAAGEFCYDGLKAGKNKAVKKLESAGLDSGFTSSNTRYFITGHSQGGACAALTGLHMVSSARSLDNGMFVYTYGSARYSKNGLDIEDLSGLINLKNKVDPVHLTPAVRVMGLAGSFVTGRPVFECLSHAGTSIEFSPATANSAYWSTLSTIYGDDLPWDIMALQPVKNHMLPSYLAGVLSKQGTSKAFDTLSRVYSVHCPVDVEVYDSIGTLCASVREGIVSYPIDSPVSILVSSDEKYIGLPDTGEYLVKCIATAEGTMIIEDQIVDAKKGEVISSKYFENVALTEGKVFSSKVDCSAETVDTRLFVLDTASGNQISEVQSDGAEVPSELGNIASGTWGTCPWEISADGVLTVHPGVGADTGDDADPIRPAWKQYSDSIERAVFAEENGAKVVATSDIFDLLSGLGKLKSADLSGLDTTGVTDMSYLFAGCRELASVDMSGLNTSRVVDMGHMFEGCAKLEELDLSGFNTSNVSDVSSMFNSCRLLKTILVGDGWSMGKVIVEAGSVYTFSDCYALVGGNGTRYSDSHKNAEYARVDTADAPGYLTAKGSTPTQPTKTSVSGATIAAIPDQAHTGSVLTPPLTVTLGGKTLVAGTDYTVAYSNNVNVGTATATITGAGDYEGTKTATFNIVAAAQPGGEQTSKVDITGATIAAIPDQVHTGSALTPPLTVTIGGKTLTAGTDYTVAYVGNVNVGAAVAIVTGTGDYTGAKTATFNIVAASQPGGEQPGEGQPQAKQDIANAAIAAIPDQTHTGSALTPPLTVTLGGRTLAAGTDYTATYAGNVNVGTASVVVIGAGAYTGVKTATFKIVPDENAGGSGDQQGTGGDKPGAGGTEPGNGSGGSGTGSDGGTGNGGSGSSSAAKVSLANAKVALSATSFTYDGKAKEPAATVTIGGKKLAAGTDYTLSYTGNVGAGTARATVTGKGSYEGTASATFEIAKAANPLKASAKKKAVSRAYLKRGPAYAYPIKVSGAVGKVTFAKKSASKKLSLDKRVRGRVVVKKGTKKGSYKMTVKVRAAGNANYEAASKKLKVTVKVK